MTETYANFDVNEFQRRIIEEFRENGGKVGGMFQDATLALLTTTGARTGEQRTVPLGYLEVDGKSVVVASAMGAPKNPAWYHNIRHDPAVTVEFGTDKYRAMAAIPDGDEYEKLWAKVVEQAPGYGDYQARTTRRIPVVVLHRLDPEPGAERVKGMGDWLVEVHDWLRKELVELRRQVDEAMSTGDGVTPRLPAPELGEQMRAHCLTFCGALNRHHVGEDMGVFPALARQFPALRPALEKLVEEHKVVAHLQGEIQRLVGDYDPATGDPLLLRDEVDRLTAELDAHFRYEEEIVVEALNATAAAPGYS
ncbi:MULTISPECIES: nitroreductase/quinone reductase family protein [unclassified Micromonospora]|uniref:nitroreductase/quinone reductase family protein n=1 Tax=unclassified Micromonospora TaxID=2617518 RepID=UPI003A886662